MQIKKFSVIASTVAAAFLLVGCNATVPAQDATVSSPSAAVSPSNSPAVETVAPAPSVPEIPSTPAQAVPAPVHAGTALAALNTLPVKGPAPKTGYSREEFGKTWDDVNGNDCDTRNDILVRDLTDIVKDSKCAVKSGTLNDLYTGTVIHFVRGGGASVDIDHVVALSDSWITGSQQISSQKRLELANDPLNLIAAQASANRQKGDKNAASWLPSNKSFRCQYVARQVAVKKKYELWVQPAEKEAIDRVLATCPDEPLPTDDTVLNSGTAPVIEEAPAPAPEAPAAAPIPASGGNDPQFSSCAQAKDAGFGPYQKDEPEYGWYRDGDKDGIACE